MNVPVPICRARHFSGSTGPRRTGFTLLEILIATLLASALMTMLWGAFNMYLRMFETGERVTREAQLLLGMSRQFTDSIQGVPALDPPPSASSELSFSAFPAPLVGDPNGGGNSAGNEFSLPNPDMGLADDIFPSGSETMLGGVTAGSLPVSSSADQMENVTELPRFGLVGSFDRLTLYGVQLVPELMPFGDFAERSGEASLPGIMEDQPPGASELRTVHFRFLQPETSPNRVAEDAHRGLLRIDTAWHEADASSWGDERLEEFLMQSENEQSGGMEAVELQIAQLRRQRDGVTTLNPDQFVLFSEVCGIKFRYYDGYVWRDTWDSRLENRLPLAVEIFLQFRGERLRRQQLLRRNQQRNPTTGSNDSDNDERELEEVWNTLELYDPGPLRSSDSGTEINDPVFRVLVPCAGAASDAPRSTGPEGSSGTGGASSRLPASASGNFSAPGSPLGGP